MSNPFAGFTMASLSVAVMRGRRKPKVVDFTSSIAEESGELLSVLMDTWAVTRFRFRMKTAENNAKLTIGFMAFDF